MCTIREKTKEEWIAEVCHKANKTWCSANHDYTQKSWNEAEQWQRESAISGVKFKLENPKAEDDAQHNAWMAEKIEQGWKFGEVKDAELKTHPLSGGLYAFILIGVIMVLSYISYPASTIPQMRIREFGDQIRTKICMPLNVKNIIIRKRNKDVYTNIAFEQNSLFKFLHFYRVGSFNYVDKILIGGIWENHTSGFGEYKGSIYRGIAVGQISWKNAYTTSNLYTACWGLPIINNFKFYKNIIIGLHAPSLFIHINTQISPQLSLSGILGNFGLAKVIKGSYTSNDDSENRNYKIRTIILWFLYFIHIAIISIGVFILRFKRVTNRRFIVGLVIIIIGFIFGILVLDQLFTPPYIEKIISL